MNSYFVYDRYQEHLICQKSQGIGIYPINLKSWVFRAAKKPTLEVNWVYVG